MNAELQDIPGTSHAGRLVWSLHTHLLIEISHSLTFIQTQLFSSYSNFSPCLCHVQDSKPEESKTLKSHRKCGKGLRR